ncbi:MAG: tRNA CCA-pyrophosphorylase [Candidatus Lokiarchaeota archaeon]|nr:tRNA CCA-pyrophosphorylase [Candidatus Lokiarchaeota archaeon]
MSTTGVKVTLTTGRTLKQGVGMEIGKLSAEYAKAVAICELDKTVFSVLDIEEGTPVRVETIEGSVVVRSKLSRRGESSIAFIPSGPYANVLMNADTEMTGMPRFKDIEALVFAAEEEEIPSVEDLIRG